MTLGQIYFWTATINKWLPLLAKEEYKKIIIDSWEYLSDRNKIDVFGFVIMPTHLHSIWRINEGNGKESSQGSFIKYTAHKFQKILVAESPGLLKPFKVAAINKNYEFWQEDTLSIPLFSRKIALQKLNYIHNNPLKGKWNLAKNPWDYKYSSAEFYRTGDTEFKFLRNLWNYL